MTRAERQARTRELLVETARTLFLRDGYAATPLDRVALEAGFSKGAVYSNFTSKEELCLAVLDQMHTRQIEEVVATFSTDTTLEHRLDAFTTWAHEHLGQPRWTALEVEFASVARQSPYVAAELATRHRTIRAGIAALIESVRAETGVEVLMDPEQAAVVLLSIGIGLGAQRSLDPGIDVNVFADTMRRLVGIAVR